jgi:hypothetical protein
MTTPRNCPTCGAALPSDAARGACPACLLEAGFETGGGAASGDRVPTVEELAPRFPGLEIRSLVGRGGMGVVFRARHKALDRDVALKVLPASVAADRAFADRFQREARALAKLQHPNIVAVHDFGRTDEGPDGLFWLVMEFVDGANIRQAMKAGQIGPKEALAIVPQICDALQYAHEHGVVHRDIKPENVLLDKTGRVKVADFGLAKLMDHAPADATLTGAGQVMGTPHYMAPEQWERPKDVDHRADIYSLGVVFYEMLTGELPIGRFEVPSHKSAVDARIDEIVMRTLAKEREARYQHVDEVKTDVGRATSPAAPSPAPSAGNETVRVTIGRHDWRAERFREAMLGIAFLVLGTLAWLVWDRDPAFLIIPLSGIVLLGYAGFRRVRGDGLDEAAPAPLTPWGRIGFAIVGACLIGTAIYAVAFKRHQDDRAILAGMLVATGILTLYVVKRWKPQREPGRRMPGWAIALIAGGSVLFCGGPLAVFAYVALSRPKMMVRETPMHVVTTAHVSDFTGQDHRDIDALWERLRREHATLTRKQAAAYYDSAVAMALQIVPADEMVRQAKYGAMGLPLASEEFLRGPLASYTDLEVEIADDRSTATAHATSPKGSIRFDLRRDDGGWRFTTSQVRFEE